MDSTEMIGVSSLIRKMPEGYEKACYDTGAIVRKRDIKDPNDLMMLALFHLLNGCSLIEISEISKLSKLGNISDVAFMKRFSNCNEWFKWISSSICNDKPSMIKYSVPECLSKYRILAVDASDVIEKGATGKTYRLHFALDIIKMQAAIYKITDNSVGEHLNNFDFSQDDLAIADRAYSTLTSMEHCNSIGCKYIARMRSNSFKISDSEGNIIDFIGYMQAHGSGELKAYAKSCGKHGEINMMPVRICFERKTDEAIEETRRKIKRRASKKQLATTLPETYSFNEYIVLITSLEDGIPYDVILALYRYRWQVELYFKRLKSILGYGDMPKKSRNSIFAWLNGKLMIALLIESIIGSGDFSPCDYIEEEYMEGDEILCIGSDNQY